jgi:hypothetical protein
MKSFLPSALSVLLLPTVIPGQTGHSQTASLAVPTTVKSTSATAKATLAAEYGKLPLSFEANQGQTDTPVRFLSRGNGYALFLTDKAAVLELTKSEPSKADETKSAARANKTDVIRMELAGASQSVQVTGAEQLPGTANYFVGNDASKWHTNVPTYAKVKYAGVYPGVDLVYYGNQSQLEYDFVVAPKADPKAVQLHFAGAEKLKLAANGDLIVAAKDGEIAFHKPVVYQVKNGQKTVAEREAVDGQFTLLADNTVGFSLGRYDKSRELVIDPTLAYSTYLANQSYPSDIAVDASGSVYITGLAVVADYPVTGASFDQTNSAKEASFVAKFNPSGTALVYSALFSGSSSSSGNDSASGIAVDAAGDAYVVGTAYSSDFPVTTGVIQTGNHAAPASNVYVLKLSPAGTALLYSTYLGGSGISYDPSAPAETIGDKGSSIVVDGSGNAYVAGMAFSTDFPVSESAFQKKNKGAANYAANLFVAKLNSNATALLYSTYLGGSGGQDGYGIPGDAEVPGGHALAVDSSGNAYIAGSTYSKNFPVTAGVLQTTFPGLSEGGNGGFISKLNPTGSGLVYSTYLGPSGTFTGVNALALDASEDAYVTGFTGVDFQVTSNAFQKTAPANVFASGGGGGTFIAKLNPQASAFLYSTYLTGSSYPYGYSVTDAGNGITLDSSGDAYVEGTAVSIGFPVTGDGYQPVQTGQSAAFLTELNPAGSALLYSTLLGGSASDSGNGIALDSSRNAYLIGYTISKTFPTTPGSLQPTPPKGKESSFNGGAFVAKFSSAPSTLISTTTVLTPSANPSILDQPLTLTATVTPTTGNGTPTGTVTFVSSSTLWPTKTVPVNSAGQATLSLASPDTEVSNIGIYSVGAVYNGSSTYARSSSGLAQSIQAAPPVFSIPSGTSSSAPLLLSLTNPNTTGYIIYTTDGSNDPFNSPTAKAYSGPFVVGATETINASVIAYCDCDQRPLVSSATYTILTPGTIQFPQGFGETAGLTLVGSASSVPPALDLTAGGPLYQDYALQAGAFYYTLPVPVQSFTTDFTFQLTSPQLSGPEPLNSIADGFTFVIQNAGLAALGKNGGGLGYAGVAKSVAVKFDLHDNAGEGPNSTGLYLDGATPTVPAVNLSGTGINLHSGDVLAAHITYDGTTLTLTITDPETTSSHTYSFPVDIPNTVGGTTAYVGFTGSTGANTATQSILSWTYVPGPPNFPNGFGPGSLGMVENGNAKVSGTALELTDGGQFEAATTFYSTPSNIQSFTTNFSFQLTNPNADGITFTIQNVGPTALGSRGSALGYQGIGKSVAIKFDLHNDAGGSDNSTGIYIDGAAPTAPDISLAGTGIDLHSGDIFGAKLTYNGTNLILTITDTVTKATFTHSFPINIPATVGGNTAYVGFTGATGFDTATQEILTWTFTNP